jgi:hypothetical protein
MAPPGPQAAHIYARRRPETTLLYQVIAENWATFEQNVAADGGSLPWFIRREVDAYLGCGILAYGFVRVHCGDCGLDRLVSFSCKMRALCPSCGVRRMVDCAAHWVDHIIPHVPVRQWVLSLPPWLRYRVAYDSALCSEVLGIFLHATLRWYRRAAKTYLGLPSVTLAQSGAITCIQRFSSSLSLNVHFHALLLDGAYVEIPGEPLRFRALPPPTAVELQELTREICRKVSQKLGLDADNAADGERLADDEPLLAACAAASVEGRIATGERAGGRVERLRTLPPQPPSEKRDCSETAGFNLHAGVRVAAHDRSRLERVCRYILRPPISQERLGPLSDGRIGYRLKHPWRDGTTYVAFKPLELLEKLVALVPPPRAHGIVFHGVLAPNARLRSQVVPKPPALEEGDRRTDAPHHPAAQDGLGDASQACLCHRCVGLPALWRQHADHSRHHADHGDSGDSQIVRLAVGAA